MFYSKFAGLRNAAVLGLVLSVLSIPAAAAQMRPATKAEIEKRLGPNASGKVASNGYTYKEGSTKGYKVTNGQICIRYPEGNARCAAITTDGAAFRMSTPGGSSAPF